MIWAPFVQPGDALGTQIFPPRYLDARSARWARLGPRQGRRGAISIGGGRCRMRLQRFGKHCETKIADQSKAMGWQDLTHFRRKREISLLSLCATYQRRHG